MKKFPVAAMLLFITGCLGISSLSAQPAKDNKSENSIILLIRGDDIGSSHTANIACIESYRNGIMRSTELMVPGPWFPEAVQLLNENPALDAGVHLVITSEWNNIKWRPLTCCPSLVDKDGYFLPAIWPREGLSKGMAFKEISWKIGEIEKEFRAQIEMAKRYVPRISHVNCHMGCEGCAPEIANLVNKLAKEYNLNVDLEAMGYQYKSLWERDDITADQRIKAAVETLKSLKPGHYYFIDHPGGNTDEMQAIWHKGYENVAADREAVTKVFTSQEVKECIRSAGITLVSYKDAGTANSSGVVSKKPVRQPRVSKPKDYSMHQDIFDLIRSEFFMLRVDGTNVYTSKPNSIYSSQQVLYVVDGMITSDISYVLPREVEKIEYLDDYQASAYGMRGGNGVLKITLKKK